MGHSRVMRGTVKQGGCVPGGGAANTVKEEGPTGVKANTGGRRSKASTANNPGAATGVQLTTGTGGSGVMVIKQEPNVEVKPDPDAATSPAINGDDTLKGIHANNNLLTGKSANAADAKVSCSRGRSADLGCEGTERSQMREPFHAWFGAEDECLRM